MNTHIDVRQMLGWTIIAISLSIISPLIPSPPHIPNLLIPLHPQVVSSMKANIIYEQRYPGDTTAWSRTIHYDEPKCF